MNIKNMMNRRIVVSLDRAVTMVTEGKESQVKSIYFGPLEQKSGFPEVVSEHSMVKDLISSRRLSIVQDVKGSTGTTLTTKGSGKGKGKGKNSEKGLDESNSEASYETGSSYK